MHCTSEERVYSIWREGVDVLKTILTWNHSLIGFEKIKFVTELNICPKGDNNFSTCKNYKYNFYTQNNFT